MEVLLDMHSRAAAVSPVTQPSAGENYGGDRRTRLGTPLQGQGLSVALSTSSLDLSCSPGSSLDSLADLTSTLAIHSPAPRSAPIKMSRLHPGESTPAPPSTKAAISGIRNTFRASKRMQQVLGFQGGPTPFVRPPNMPKDLVEAYYEGWYEYGADAVGTNLSPIKEAGHEELGGYETLESEDEADDTSRGSHAQPFNDEESLPLLGTAEVLTNQEGANEFLHTSSTNGHYGSSRELREQAATNTTHDPSVSRANPDVTLNDLSNLLNPQEVRVGDQNRSKKVLRLPSWRNLRSLHDELADVGDGGLFDSGLVKPASRPSSSHSDAGSIFSALAGRAPLEASLSLHPAPDHFFSTLFSGPAPLRSTTSLPDIVVTSSTSPPPTSRKRRAHAQEDSDIGGMPSSGHPMYSSAQGRPMKKARCTQIILTGLPALRSNEIWGWLSAFPGNTAGLSHTLLTWHATMQSFFAQVKDARLLSYHPMFPYSPTKPKNVPLVSVSFWDTGGETHRELWYVGPGDVEVLSYNEVDTFGARMEMNSDQCKMHSRFRRLLKREEIAGKEIRDQALTGDGRWSFVVMRGHADEIHTHEGSEPSEQGEPAPYVLIAFPTSAVTKSTQCLHMLYPDDYQPTAATAKPVADIAQPNRPVTITSKLPVARVASVPVLSAAIHTRPPKARRPLSSIDLNAPSQRPSRLQGLKEASDALMNKGNNTALRRTILWFEKAGQSPLIEGYRTDLSLWQPFLEAVARGQAKVMLWCETEDRVME